MGRSYVEHTIPPAGLTQSQLDGWTTRNALWPHLYSETFVAAVDLTLQVTDTDSVGYSYSAITPLTGAGKSALPYTYAGMGATSGTNNSALAVGLSVSGTQDRNVEQDYNLDVRRIVDAYIKAGLSSDTSKDNHFPSCGSRSGNPSLVKRLESSLQGNLALSETLEDGLIALNRSRTYNVYGTSGPTRLIDVLGPPAMHTLGDHGPPGGGGGGTGGGGGSAAGSSSGKTSFASKVDFYLTDGIGGGPTYALLLRKLAAGSGGGGGGGSSGSSGVGGGGQPLNFSRMTQDSFTVTFGATCKQPVNKEAEINAQFEVLSGNTGTDPATPTTIQGLRFTGSTADVRDGMEATSASDGGKSPYDFSFTITNIKWLAYRSSSNDPPFQSTPGPINSVDQLYLTRKDAAGADQEIAEGQITWTGYIAGNGDYDARGVVKSLITGNVVGQIWLSGKSSDLIAQNAVKGALKIHHMPYFLRAHLADDQVDQSYWGTIPGCDALTAGQIQAVTDDLTNKTLLQAYLRP